MGEHQAKCRLLPKWYPSVVHVVPKWCQARCSSGKLVATRWVERIPLILLGKLWFWRCYWGLMWSEKVGAWWWVTYTLEWLKELLEELTKIYFHKNSHRVVDKTSHILYFFYQVVSIVLYNLMTNRLVNSDLKDRLRGAAHLGRAGGLQDNRFFFHHYYGYCEGLTWPSCFRYF